MDRCGALFLCLCLLMSQSRTEEASQEILRWMKKMEMAARSRSLTSFAELIHGLESRLLNASFGGHNLTLRTHTIQTLAFKLGCNFTGLSLRSAALQQAPQAQVPLAMQFPAELTHDACRVRPRELTLICIYFSNTRFFQKDINSSVLNNYVLGAQLSHGQVSNLREPVNISFWHNQSLEDYTVTCVFWKEGASKHHWGAWSTEGCRTEQPSPSQVLCRCNHLTYFAVLMQLSQAPVPAELLAPLTYISLVGCSISIVASLLTVLLHLLARKPSDSLTCIHVNLHASVLLLNVAFLLSPVLAVPPVPESACVALAATLHYGLLSSFTWMAIEGFNLYLLLGRVYNIYIRRYVLKLCALGWDAGCGTPGCTVSWSWALVASHPFSTWWCWPGRYGSCTDCGRRRRRWAPGPAGIPSPCWASPCCWAPPGSWPSSPLVSSCCPSSSSSPPSIRSTVSSSSCGSAPRGAAQRQRWRHSAPPSWCSSMDCLDLLAWSPQLLWLPAARGPGFHSRRWQFSCWTSEATVTSRGPFPPPCLAQAQRAACCSPSPGILLWGRSSPTWGQQTCPWCLGPAGQAYGQSAGLGVRRPRFNAFL
ncbi:adhesion G-protein coupled receptor G5 isoform X2 [Phocoena sinus]|uniref:adhesion G-protein coupled receptor G5 isoform X2 n=1 Tax=Phocoena sinus TaxID=42100 RepID=UPI0013C40ACA|nr:adhesion G-protein coupled receptor G5 isoform X2 [Phocoena sinus]